MEQKHTEEIKTTYTGDEEPQEEQKIEQPKQQDDDDYGQIKIDPQAAPAVRIKNPKTTVFKKHQSSKFLNSATPVQQQQSAAEQLKILNFTLNPHMHKRKLDKNQRELERKKREEKRRKSEVEKKRKSEVGFKKFDLERKKTELDYTQISYEKRATITIDSEKKKRRTDYKHHKPTAVTRNILELRDRNNKKNISLMDKPRLKSTKSFKCGSLSILKNNAEARNYITQKYQGFVSTGHQTLGEKGKDKLRLQVVRWFQEHKVEIIQLINEKRKQIIDWIEYVNQVNKQEFELIMDHIGLKKDRNLLNRIFWLFDLNGDEQIDSHEISYAIDLFNEETLEEKVEILFELARESDEDYVTTDELKRFFVKNLKKEDEIKQAKYLTQNFIDELKPRKKEGFTIDELMNETMINPHVRIIVEKNTRILKTAKSDDYVIPLSSLIPVQETDTKPGSLYPAFDHLMDYLTVKEQQNDKNQNYKIDHLHTLSSVRDDSDSN